MTTLDDSTKAALDKLATIGKELNQRYFEREEVIRGALAALVAGEHVLLLGPVGTAKSMLVAELCARLDGAEHFSWLLTRFSTPEELFGPISLSALEDDRYERLTSGKLPEAHVAFLDEIFKANSAILNSLLALVNERVFHNGTEPQTVPLISLFAASNELPEEGELSALFDRFLVRYVIGYIEEDYRFIRMLGANEAGDDETHLTLDELVAIRRAVEQVSFDEVFLGDIARIRARLAEKGIVASDRRYRKAVHLLRAFALVDGRDEVTQRDLEELANVLWSDPEDRSEVQLTIQEVFVGHEDEARKLLYQAREVRDYALRNWDDAETAMRASIEAHTKLSRILADARKLVDDARKRRRRLAEVSQIASDIEELQKQILAEGV